MMHAPDNPLVRTRELDRVVAVGRERVADYLMGWTLRSIADAPQEAFKEALSGVEEEWLSEVRIRALIRDPKEIMPRATEEERRRACLRAREEIAAFFSLKLYERKQDVLSEARARLRCRADQVRIRVFRGRIDVVDLQQNQKLYPHD